MLCLSLPRYCFEKFLRAKKPVLTNMWLYTISFGYFHIDKWIIFTFFIKNTLDIDALHTFIYIINRNV